MRTAGRGPAAPRRRRRAHVPCGRSTWASAWSAVVLYVLVGVLVAEGQPFAAGVFGVVCQPLDGQLGPQLEGRVLAEVRQHLVLFLGEVLAVLGPGLPHPS